jgi:hypothetical protein
MKSVTTLFLACYSEDHLNLHVQKAKTIGLSGEITYQTIDNLITQKYVTRDSF